MKTAKKWITLNERIGKWQEKERTVESGKAFNMIAQYKCAEKINEIYIELTKIEKVLTEQEKSYINDYYSCEMFEV